MQIDEAWVIGISGSLIASIIVLSVTYLSTKVIIPKVRGIMLQVPDISGSWEMNDKSKDGKLIKRQLLIKQRGIRIEAELVRHHKYKRIFKYHGTFQSGQVVLNFEEKGGEGFIMGSMVLHLSSSRHLLSGKAVYYQYNRGQVVASDRVYEKC